MQWGRPTSNRGLRREIHVEQLLCMKPNWSQGTTVLREVAAQSVIESCYWKLLLTNKGSSEETDSSLFYHCFLKPDPWTLHPWPFTPGWPSTKSCLLGSSKQVVNPASCPAEGLARGPPYVLVPLLTRNTCTLLSRLPWPGRRASHPRRFGSSNVFASDFLKLHLDSGLGRRSREIGFQVRMFLQPILTLNGKCPSTPQSYWESFICLFLQP